MLEFAVNSEVNAESQAPVLSHYYAVAMDASEDGTSAISAGESTNCVT